MTLSCLALNYLRANCYCLCDPDSGEGIVVDPGEYTEELTASVEAEGIRDLKTILLTHGHFDHILGVSLLKKRFPDAQIAIGAPDAVCLYDSEANQLIKEYESAFIPCRAERLLGEGDEIRFGQSRLEVIKTPGHTKGGLCFICPEDRFVLTGDTLFCRTAGRTDLVGGDYSELLASVSRLMELPDDYIIYPGHNRSTTIGDERAHNRFWRHR